MKTLFSDKGTVCNTVMHDDAQNRRTDPFPFMLISLCYFRVIFSNTVKPFISIGISVN